MENDDESSSLSLVTETNKSKKDSETDQVQENSSASASELLVPEPAPESPSINNPVTAPESDATNKNSKFKVNVLLKPVGDAPILKQKLWSVDPDKPVSSIIIFTKKCLRLEPGQSLFLFVNQAFAPSPDQLIRNLYECFGSDGKLILHYSTTVAWG